MTELPAMLQLPPATPVEAIRWIRTATKWIGPGFHPDTRGRDYVNDQGRSFTDEQADQLDHGVQACLEQLQPTKRDPYEVGLRIQRRMLGRTYRLTATEVDRADLLFGGG